MSSTRDWREFNDAWRKPGPRRTPTIRETEPRTILAAAIGLVLGGASNWFDYAGHVQDEGAVLRDADLNGTSLRNADLGGRRIIKKKINGADLSGADLSYAHLRGANLGRAKLSDANLAGTDLTQAILSEADLTRAKWLHQEQLNQACGDENTKLPEELTIPMC